MLKNLFGSKARVKILQIFLLNPDKEYFVRELTRKLDEQINSIRRELLNLKKIGILKYRMRNRKKYFYVDPSFIIYEDLKSIILKTQDTKEEIVQNITKMGKVDLLILGGLFTNDPAATVDLFVVGQIDKEKLEGYIEMEIKADRDIKYSLMDRDNFLYRLECNDKFVNSILQNKKNIVVVNRLKTEW